MDVLAEQDFARRDWLGVGHNRQPGAAHALQVTLQFLRRVTLRRNRVGGDHDAVVAPTFFNERRGSQQPRAAHGDGQPRGRQERRTTKATRIRKCQTPGSEKIPNSNAQTEPGAA